MRHTHPWRYYASPAAVVDADTIDLEIDVGFHTHRRERIRLNRVDTAELPPELHFERVGIEDLDAERRAEYSDAIEQLEYVQGWLAEALDRHTPPLIVETYQQTGSFGRYLGEVYRATPSGNDVATPSLSDELLAVFGDEIRY